MRRATAAALLLALLPAGAAAIPDPSDSEMAQGLVWVPQPVAFPVAPENVSPEEPYVPAHTREIAGPVAVGPRRAAAFWLDPLELVRVRVQSKDPDPRIIFERVAGPGVVPDPNGGSNSAPAARLKVDEPGIKDPLTGATWLVEPPGNGSVWMIEAPAEVRILVERAAARKGRLAWEAAANEIIGWIDRHDASSLATLPRGGGELAFELDADAELARELAKSASPRLAEAITAWRTASALERLERARPMVRPWFSIDELDGELPGRMGSVTLPFVDPTDPDPRAWRRIAGTCSAHTVTIDGPAILRLEARGILDHRPPDAPLMTIAIRRGEETLSVDRFDPSAVRAADPTTGNRAFPDRAPLTSSGGEWVGVREHVEIRVPPGAMTYTVTLTGGPMLARLSAARAQPLSLDSGHPRHDAWTLARRARVLMDGETGPAAETLRGRLSLLLGDAEPSPPRIDSLPPLLRVDRAASWLASSPPASDARTALEDRLGALFKAAGGAGGPRSVVWSIRLSLARHYGATGDSFRVRAVLRDAPDAPPAPVLAALADYLPEPLPFEDADSRRLAFEELAWRLAPADKVARMRYSRLWSRTEWTRLPPNGGSKPPNGFPFSPWTWLSTLGRDWDRDDPRPVRSNDAFANGYAWRVGIGVKKRAHAVPSNFDPAQSSVLRFFVRTPDAAPGPFTVHVDQKEFRALGVERLEKLEIAVAPATQPIISVDAPKGSDAFVSIAPGDESWPKTPSEYARTLRLRPTTFQGAPVRYLLPDPNLPGPLQITLAALTRGPAGTASSRESVDIRLRTDQGFSRTLSFLPGPADPGTEAIDAPGPITSPISVVVSLPAGIHAVWIQSRTDDVVAAFSIREPRSYAAPPAEEIALKNSDPLSRLAALSRRLAARPDDARLLVARAQALLDLGEVDYAQQDAIRLVKREKGDDDDALIAMEDELFERISTGTTPAFIAIHDPDAPKTLGVAPGALALGDAPLDDFLPAVRAARASGSAAAIAALASAPPGPYASWLRARLLDEGDRYGASALALYQLYEETGAWQFGLESLPAFRRFAVLEATKPGDIARIYGAAARVREEIEHPLVRETMLAATRTSEWTPITDTDGSAGFQTLSMDPGTQLTQPIAAIRQAMIASPWPAREARVITPGNGTGLDLTLARETSLKVEIWCERIRWDDPGEPNPCELSARLDQNAARLITGNSGKPVSTSFGQLPAGRHHVEVYLTKPSRAFLASVHFSNEGVLSAKRTAAHGSHVEVEQASRAFLAKRDRPVTLAVLGPTVLSIEARRPQDAGARVLDVAATPIAGIEGAPIPKSASAASRKITLDATPDATVRNEDGSDARVTRPVGAVLLLPDAAVYRVAIRPDAGTALVRLAFREDGREPDSVDPLAWRQQTGEGKELLRAPSLPGGATLGEVPAEARIDARSHAGSIFISSIGGREAQQTNEGTKLAGNARVETDAGWHAELLANRGWLQFTGRARANQNGFPTAGARTDAFAQLAGFRAQIRGEYMQGRARTIALDGSGTISAGTQTATSGEGYLDRRIDLGRTTFLLPSLRVRVTGQSIVPGNRDTSTTGQPDPAEPDPELYSLYRATHPRQLEARMALWWEPALDQLFEVRGGARSRRNWTGVDAVDGVVDWRGLLGLGPVDTRLEMLVEASRWMATSDRDSTSVLSGDGTNNQPKPGSAYDSARLTVSLEPALWHGATRKSGRVSLLIRDALLVFDRAHPAANTFEVGLRWDFVGGRGLRDILPLDVDFTDIAGHRWWDPAPEEE